MSAILHVDCTNSSQWLVARHWSLATVLRSFRPRRQILKKLVGIRLGAFHQYAPRPLRMPHHYTAGGKTENVPIISIVTPSFNQGKFLERTVQSVLQQKYARLEYVVQDGGSTDASVQILKRSRLTHWESSPDRGQADAINRGHRHTTGEIMAYLNSDDLLLPGTLHYVAKFFAAHPDVDVVYGHRILIDENDNEVGRWVLPPHDRRILSWADYVPQETLFWRRRIWDKVGGLDESFQFAMDWDLLLRFQEVRARFRRLPRFLAAFRIHAAQKTSSRLFDVGWGEFERLWQRCHKRPISERERSWRILPYVGLHYIYDKLYRLGLLRY